MFRKGIEAMYQQICCNLCQHQNNEEIYTIKGLQLLTREEHISADIRHCLCNHCGLVFINPRLNKQVLQAFYTNQYSETTKLTTHSPDLSIQGTTVQSKQLEFILEHLPDFKTVLDVGSFDGYFLSLCKEIGVNPVGIEPSQIACDYAQKTFQLTVHCGFFEETTMDKTFDLITFRHVLEHMEDPYQSLLKAREYLHSRGHLFIEVPNVLNPMIDNLSDFFTFQHLYNFSPTTLNNLLYRAGFRVIADTIELPYSGMRFLAQKVSLPTINASEQYQDPKEVNRIKKTLLHYKYVKAQHIKRINDRLRPITTNNEKNPIGIFGAGMHTRYLLDNTILKEYPSLVLFDNNPEKHHQTIWGLPVFAPQEIAVVQPQSIIISSYDFQEEIYKQLLPFQTKGIQVIRLYDKVQSYSVSQV